MPGRNPTSRVHDIRAYRRARCWAQRMLLLAALEGAVPSRAHANDLNREAVENVNMQAIRGVRAAKTAEEIHREARVVLGQYLQFLREGGRIPLLEDVANETDYMTGGLRSLMQDTINLAQEQYPISLQSGEEQDPTVRYLLLLGTGISGVGDLDKAESLLRRIREEVERGREAMQREAAMREVVRELVVREVMVREVQMDAAQAANLFMEFAGLRPDEMGACMRQISDLIARNSTEGRINREFFDAFWEKLAGYQGIVRGYAIDKGFGMEELATQQNFIELMEHVHSIASAMETPEYDIERLKSLYGEELVAAVQQVRERVYDELSHALLAQAFDPNDLVADNFEPENWLAGVFSAENITETGTPSIEQVFGNLVGRLQKLVPGEGESEEERQWRRDAIVDLVERSYHVDLSGMDASARERMVSRVEEFIGLVVHLATYNVPEGLPSYSKFVDNVENARAAVRMVLDKLEGAVRRSDLLAVINQIRNDLDPAQPGVVEAYRSLRPEFYGRFADFIINHGIFGTTLFGMREGEPAESPRGIIRRELGLPEAVETQRGIEFLLSVYEKVGTEAFYRERQGRITELDGMGIQPLLEEREEELPQIPTEEGLGTRLFGSLDLLSQYALLKNYDTIFRHITAPRITPRAEGESVEEAERRGERERAAHEEQYVERLIGLALEVAPGSAFFLFNSALPVAAENSGGGDDFFRMCDGMHTALDHLTGYNSPYLFYGSQNGVNSYLHIQVPRAVRETTSGARAMTETLLRFTSVFPEAEDWRLELKTGMEPASPVTGPIPPFRGVWRDYVDWAPGITGSRFQNLPIEVTALTFPQELRVGAMFNRLESLITTSLGVGTNVDNTSAALAALIAALHKAALYNETELGRFMRNEYLNLLRFFQSPQDVRVTFHTGGRAAFYEPFDLYSRLAVVELGLPPLIPEAVFRPARGGVEAGARMAGGEGVPVTGAAAAAAEARGPTAGMAGGAAYRGAEEAGEVTAGVEVAAPRVEAAAVSQGVWYEEEKDAAVLARLNGMGEDSDYALLFDFVDKERTGEGTGLVVRGQTYVRFGTHWLRGGVFDIEGEREALGRFANTLVTNLGPIGMAGYKYDSARGMVSFTGVIGDPEEIAGFGIAGNTEKIFSLVCRYATIEGSHLAAGGLGFLLSEAFSLGLVGRGAALASDDAGHGGGLVVLDYNKQSTRVTGSVGFDWNPVTYMINNAGQLGVMSYEGGFLSGSLAARGLVDEANFWEAYLRGYVQVTPEERRGETAGVEAGGVYSARDLRIRAVGSYEQWLRRRAAGEEAGDISRMGGGALEISWTTEQGTEVTIKLGGEYSTDYLVGEGILRFDQRGVINRLFDYWNEYNRETDPELKARALYNFGQTMKVLARIRRISSQGVESMREACDLMAAGSLVVETAEHLFTARVVGVREAEALREARGVEEERFGGAAGAGWRMKSDGTSIALSGNLGQEPTGLIVFDVSGVFQTEIGAEGSFELGGTFSRNVWEEWGVGGIIGGRYGRSQFGAQVSYLWGGNQGVDYVWNVAPYYAYTREDLEVRAGVSVGEFGLSRLPEVAEEERRREVAKEERRWEEFEAYQIGARFEYVKPSWSVGVGGNIIPAGGVMGGGLAVEGAYRDINRYLESIGGRAEYQNIEGQWYLTFQLVGRF